MKSTFLFLAIFASYLAVGQVKQTRNVSTFSNIEVSGAFEVFIRMGDESGVTVVADEEIIDNITTVVDDYTLEVEYDSDWWDFKNKSSDVKIYITMKKVRSLEFNGACEVNGKNALRGESIDIECTGASEINLDLNCNELDLELSGASEVRLSGQCRKVNIEASGASEINAADLRAITMNMDVSGASSAEVNVSEQLNIEASGASEVRYSGNPSITKDVSGASSISKR